MIITTLKFASGAIGSYETSWVLPDNHVELDAKLDITGTDGVLNIDILDQNIRVYEKEFPMGMKEAYRAVKVVEAIEESIKTGRSVEITE